MESKTISKYKLMVDEELMLHLSNGEVSAFDELYMRYSKRLLGYFIRMLNFDKELAEDALQDLFMKVAETPETFDRERSFKTWIFSVAANRCKNYYRHKKIAIETHEQITYIEDKTDESSFIKLASKIDGLQFRKTLQDTLNELPAEKKEAFILKYQEEKTISEIAYIQNCPEGSVKSRLHYTLKTLEDKLKIFNPVN
ncbi:MAG TPA: sigma-70 family RNA polymerase sigma factor [Bacteroidia bacterium]|jgi:RNA polymerase sigma-70 factor (ECF subfamily)|nr:sigma-70 family RNA polymerase sigma factor [Bacteroidia bacterium]